jgi:hypothetical protein
MEVLSSKMVYTIELDVEECRMLEILTRKQASDIETQNDKFVRTRMNNEFSHIIESQ